jgi:hypothetical protein
MHHILSVACLTLPHFYTYLIKGMISKKNIEHKMYFYVKLFQHYAHIMVQKFLYNKTAF